MDIFDASSCPDVFLMEVLKEALGLKPFQLFEDDNLNHAFANLLLFDMGDHDIFHIKVSEVALGSFVDAMENDPETRLLRFTCMCDAGDERLEKTFLHHCHMIVVSPNKPRNRFLDRVWSKVQISEEDKPFENYACASIEPILTKMNLINTMGRLGRRESHCMGIVSEKGAEEKNRETRPSHYDIRFPLPKDYEWSWRGTGEYWSSWTKCTETVNRKTWRKRLL